jgi:general secretion pathway protein H
MTEQRAQGFTLLELMVVIAIAALILVAVVPSGRNRREHEALVASAHDIASSLRLTRARAIIADQPAAFLVDVETGFYRGPGASAARAVPRGSRLELFTAQEDELSDRVGAIQFFPDGSSSGGGVAVSFAGERMEILVDWLTGGVSIHEQRAGG